MPRAAARGHQGVDIERDGLDRRALQQTRWQCPSLPFDSPPLIGGHATHPGIEHAGGDLPAPQSVDLHREDRRRLLIGLGQSGPETLSHEEGGGIPEEPPELIEFDDVGVHRLERGRQEGRPVGHPTAAGPRPVQTPGVEAPHQPRNQPRPLRSTAGRTTGGDGRPRGCPASSGRCAGSTSESTASKSSATTTERGTSWLVRTSCPSRTTIRWSSAASTASSNDWRNSARGSGSPSSGEAAARSSPGADIERMPTGPCRAGRPPGRGSSGAGSGN